MNIFLIGYRCTGKTSIGKHMAKRLGWRFVDADELLMEKTGETVSAIVERDGWARFRALEKEVLRTICTGTDQVVATGGGVVADPENIRRMKQNGIAVWLRASTDTIHARMLQDHQSRTLRPSLTDRRLIEEIRETLLERTALYRNAMSIEVDTEDKSVSDVSLEVIDTLTRIGQISFFP